MEEPKIDPSNPIEPCPVQVQPIQPPFSTQSPPPVVVVHDVTPQRRCTRTKIILLVVCLIFGIFVVCGVVAVAIVLIVNEASTQKEMNHNVNKAG